MKKWPEDYTVVVPLDEYERLEADAESRRGPILEMYIPYANAGYENFIDGRTIYVRGAPEP